MKAKKNPRKLRVSWGWTGRVTYVGRLVNALPVPSSVWEWQKPYAFAGGQASVFGNLRNIRIIRNKVQAWAVEQGDGISQVGGREVGVPHRHHDTAVPE